MPPRSSLRRLCLVNGNTNVSIGVAWSMEALTPDGPLATATAMSDARVPRILIVLSDGDNTQKRWEAQGCGWTMLATFDGASRTWETVSMSNTPTRNVSLTVELTAYIDAQVASGHYSNASEVVRAGLRLLIERDRALSDPARPTAQGYASADHRSSR
jgi:putative addiction module CopG family antidote